MHSYIFIFIILISSQTYQGTLKNQKIMQKASFTMLLKTFFYKHIIHLSINIRLDIFKPLFFNNWKHFTIDIYHNLPHPRHEIVRMGYADYISHIRI